MSATPNAYARQESPPPQKSVLSVGFPAHPVPYAEEAVPTPQEAYEAMIALREDSRYLEGTPWTNDTPYSLSNAYYWKGGVIDGNVKSGVGCAAFAFILSDEAFGNLPARMSSNFKFSDVKVGDILRVDGGSHTVIVLQVSDSGVTIAEGNYNGTVHWGRGMSAAEVEAADSLVTRYPEGYIPPDDPTANDPLEEGTLEGGLTWLLTKSGTLTISGNGAMPDFASSSEQPWSAGNILKIVIEDGVTNVGSCAFWGSKALSVRIPASVETIGTHAFRASSLLAVTIPSSVKTIEDSAFRECKNLISATIPEGVETIGGNAFRACTALTSIVLPASVGNVGAAAFMDCREMTQAAFVSGSNTVQMGDNLFTECWKLSNVTLPAQIDRISDGMFMNCLMLTTLKIPQGAESIGERAFASCSMLASVAIPESVTQIWTAAFANCGVTDIYFGGNEAQWKSISKMGDTLETKTIHYNSTLPDPDPTPDPDPDPNPDPNPNPNPDPNPDHTHSWDNGTVTTPAGCTSSGTLTYTCSDCGDTKTETISATGHSYEDVTEDATCTKAGRTASTCSKCGDIRSEKIIPAKGHLFVPIPGDTDGLYQCENESGMVVSSILKESYEAVVTSDVALSDSTYQIESDADAKQYVLNILRAVVPESVSLTINKIEYISPTQAETGKYVYTVTISLNTRALTPATELTTEPLTVTIPKLPGSTTPPPPAPTPDPDPTPDHSSGSSWADTNYISIPKSPGGSVVSSIRFAEEGERVTFSVHPDAGYELSELTVSTARGRDLSVRDLGDNRFSFTMPNNRVTIEAVFAEPASEATQPDSTPSGDSFSGLGTPGISGIALNPSPMPFTDVSVSDWYYHSVDYVWKHYLMSGTSDTHFAPNQTTSRAMIWTILARMHHIRTDINSSGTWYEKGMLWAIEQGITDGSNPMGNITREQLAVMLWRNAGKANSGGSLDRFSDAADVSSYAVSAVQWAVSCGILQGSDGRLNPQGTATRAEVAAMVMRSASNT